MLTKNARRALGRRAHLGRCALMVLASLGSVSLAASPQTELAAFLAALEGSPELVAAQSAREAAELQLQATYDPVALQAQGGYNRFDVDEGALTGAQVGPPGGGAAELPETAYQLETTLSFRPFPFGDVADQVAQREIELEQAQLSYASTKAGLEGRSLRAALAARLAERSVELAEAGVEAAQQGLRATEVRARKDAANARDLREARAALTEAQTLLQNARLDLQVARQNLSSLVGDAQTPSYEVLSSLSAPPAQTPVSVEQSRLQTRLAAVGIDRVVRQLYPVASASYSYNVSDYSTLSASIESRTLQPSVGFKYQDPARALPESAIEGTLSVGVSANISVGAIQALEAVQKQRASAEAALQAATQGATLQEASLRAALDKAAGDAALKRLEFDNASASYDENLTRQDLGLSTPIETQGSLLALLQADLERRSSELAALGAKLDLFELYALPPSETLR